MAFLHSRKGIGTVLQTPHCDILQGCPTICSLCPLTQFECEPVISILSPRWRSQWLFLIHARSCLLYCCNVQKVQTLPVTVLCVVIENINISYRIQISTSHFYFHWRISSCVHNLPVYFFLILADVAEFCHFKIKAYHQFPKSLQSLPHAHGK